MYMRKTESEKSIVNTIAKECSVESPGHWKQWPVGRVWTIGGPAHCLHPSPLTALFVYYCSPCVCLIFDGLGLQRS